MMPVPLVSRPEDEHEAAHRLYKQYKNGVIRQGEFAAEHYGLLYVWYPELLPDVDEEVRQP